SEHAVVRLVAGATKACAVRRNQAPLEGFRLALAAPRQEENDVTRRKDRVEHVPADEPLRLRRKPEPTRERLGLLLWQMGGAFRVDQRDGRALADLGLVQPLLLQLMP